MAEDANNGKNHAGEIAVGVADEDAGGVLVVDPKGEGDADKGEEEEEGEEVRVRGRVGVASEDV